MAASLSIGVFSCQIAKPVGAPVDPGRLRDGTFFGESRSGPNSATVRVVLKGGRIEAVDVLGQFASWKGAQVQAIIPQRIVEAQSTTVDAVSGATNSSVVLMNAVQNAIEKAYRDNP